MEKLLEIEEGRSYNFRASAFSPIQYNRLFPGHDYMKDINAMVEKSEEMKGETDSEENEKPDNVEFSMENYEQFVRLAYTFAYQGLSPTPFPNQEQKDFLKEYPDPWTWIDSFDTFSIYMLLPEIVNIWAGNSKQLVKAKNRQAQPPVK